MRRMSGNARMLTGDGHRRKMMAKRGKGEGTIYQRADGRWEASVTLPGSGRRRRRSFYAKTRAEVARKLRDTQRALDENQTLPPENLTLEKHLLLLAGG